MADPEITKRIARDELERLVESISHTTRITAEIPAVDLDQLLLSERAPVPAPVPAVGSGDIYLPLTLGDAFDSATAILLGEAFVPAPADQACYTAAALGEPEVQLGAPYLPPSIATPIDPAPVTFEEPLPSSLAEVSVEALVDLGDLLRNDLGEDPAPWLDPPTERKRMRITFEPTANVFST